MGLLDGDIARLVRDGLKGAGMYKAATLIKTTTGSRSAASLAGGTVPTSTSYDCEGLVVTTNKLKIGGTLVESNDRAVLILGDSLTSGITPATRDRLTIEGVTQSIVGVDRDPASAAYTCLCRG